MNTYDEFQKAFFRLKMHGFTEPDRILVPLPLTPERAYALARIAELQEKRQREEDGNR